MTESMSASKLGNYREPRHRHKLSDTRRRAAGKREIDAALEDRMVDLAEDAHEIRGLCQKFSATSDVDGLAAAIMDYVSTRPNLIYYAARLQAITDKYRQPHNSEMDAEQYANSRHTLELAQTRLSNMEYEFEQLLKELAS